VEAVGCEGGESVSGGDGGELIDIEERGGGVGEEGGAGTERGGFFDGRVGARTSVASGCEQIDLRG